MQTEREMAIQKLFDLIEVSRDAEKGFRLAATETNDLRTRAIFQITAQQRKDNASKLQTEMRKFGVKPPVGGSIAGLLHRGWMNVRYQLSLHSEASVKVECLRGEEQALGVYQDLFWDKSLQELQPMLEEQYVKIIEMRDRLRDETHPEDKKPEDSILLL
jgi:uncharacterized protein (TIGR02284 family)